MADWEHDDQARAGYPDRSLGGDRDWRGGRDWRDKNDRADPAARFGGADRGRVEPRSFDDGRGARGPREERTARYERYPRSLEQSGAAARGYGDGGDTSFGQMATGSSDSGLGGYSGADVGGYGQPNLNSQWGQGGYAPLNQGLDYGQDGGSFRPAGFDADAYGPSSRREAGRPDEREPHHDPHQASYHHWRSTQLSSHDRDYARWRDEQARRYDEDYGSWRNERHSAFSKEFEGWRAGRGGQAGVPAPAQSTASSGSVASSAAVNPSERSVYGQAASSSAAGEQSFAHGANPTLARIADGENGHHHHDKADRTEADNDPSKR